MRGFPTELQGPIFEKVFHSYNICSRANINKFHKGTAIVNTSVNSKWQQSKLFIYTIIVNLG